MPGQTPGVGDRPRGPAPAAPASAEVSADPAAYLLEGTASGQGQLTQGAAGSSDPLRTKPAWQRSQRSPSVLCWQPWGGGHRLALMVGALLPPRGSNQLPPGTAPRPAGTLPRTHPAPGISVSVTTALRPLVPPSVPLVGARPTSGPTHHADARARETAV